MKIISITVIEIGVVSTRGYNSMTGTGYDLDPITEENISGKLWYKQGNSYYNSDYVICVNYEQVNTTKE